MPAGAARVDGVLEATLDAMEALGAQPRTTSRAVIGPTISQSAYEVGPEFLDGFRDEDPDNAALLRQWHGRPDAVRPARLRPCTACARPASARPNGPAIAPIRDPERFYSYRRTTHAGEADYGRLISAIRL